MDVCLSFNVLMCISVYFLWWNHSENIHCLKTIRHIELIYILLLHSDCKGRLLMKFYYPCQFAKFSSKWQSFDELIAMSIYVRESMCVFVCICLTLTFCLFPIRLFVIYIQLHTFSSSSYTKRLDNTITKWIFVQWTHALYFALLEVPVSVCLCV